jgi:hypothetical protein
MTITEDSPLTGPMQEALIYMSIETLERLRMGGGSLYGPRDSIAQGLVRRGCIVACVEHDEGEGWRIHMPSWDLTAKGRRVVDELWATRPLHIVERNNCTQAL